MTFDCIIIGGGIAGLTCGIKCAREGLQCAILSAGVSALHFSSGSIDLLSYESDKKVVYAPLEFLPGFVAAHPEHPYAKCGPEAIETALFFLRDEVGHEGFELCCNERENHFHVTSLGTLKPTFFSQRSVFNELIKAGYARKLKAAIITIEGFRDFYPAIAAANLARNKLFKDMEIVTGSIRLSEFRRSRKNPHEFRSIDIARLFDSGRYLDEVAGQIMQIAGDARFIGMPAFFGISNYGQVLKKLEAMTGRMIYEIPTLPPSILGMRLDNALKSRFAALGGVYIAGDRVIGGKIKDGRIRHIHTQNYGDIELRARHFVLATGSFFSGGMTSRFDAMQEPVFGLTMAFSQGRNTWYSPDFFDNRSHPFLEFGVRTDADLHPVDSSGNRIENLFCAGAILSHYDPVKEGSGSGVAISTGYKAAERIIADFGL